MIMSTTLNIIPIEIPHHSLLTSSGANQKSWFLYMKTKG